MQLSNNAYIDKDWNDLWLMMFQIYTITFLAATYLITSGL